MAAFLRERLYRKINPIPAELSLFYSPGIRMLFSNFRKHFEPNKLFHVFNVYQQRNAFENFEWEILRSIITIINLMLDYFGQILTTTPLDDVKRTKMPSGFESSSDECHTVTSHVCRFRLGSGRRFRLSHNQLRPNSSKLPKHPCNKLFFSKEVTDKFFFFFNSGPLGRWNQGASNRCTLNEGVCFQKRTVYKLLRQMNLLIYSSVFQYIDIVRRPTRRVRVVILVIYL